MLDKNGFKRKTYDELVNEMSAKAKEHFGSDANVSSRAALGIFIRVMAWFLSLLWQDLEDVYYSAYRKSAEGVQLDKLLPYAGITRNLAEYAYGQVTLNGTAGHTVESGFLVGTATDINFETLYDVTLDANGTAVSEIVCTTIGSTGNVNANTITIIVNPDANVTSVNNTEPTTGGREKESDAEARARSEVTVDGLGSATGNAIRAHLLSISDVRAARVIDNDTDTVDEFGTPSRALQTFVLGGDDEDIAYSIFNKKSGGIRAYGTTVVDVIDDSSRVHQVGFTRATEVSVHVNVQVRTNTLFKEQDIAQIKDLLVKYVGGVDTTGIIHAGLNMGDSVVVSRMVSRLLLIALKM